MHLDVVYVCIAFRLHLLGTTTRFIIKYKKYLSTKFQFLTPYFHSTGFLNLDLQECSGNQGLKDIILGLRWIKDNISAFGGDPDNVTLLGSSCGAVTIHHIILSPLAKGRCFP